MRTVRRACAIVFLTTALSTFTFGEEGWIGTGYKPPQQPTPTSATPQEMSDSDIADTGEESSYFDEIYEATLLFLQMNLL